MGSILTRVLTQVIIDGLSLFFVFLPWILLQTIATPYKRGFFCDDESIMYPYKDNTISNNELVGCGFALTIVVILIVELTQYFCLRNKTHHTNSIYKLSNDIEIPYTFVIMYKTFGIFLFGLAFQQTIVNVGKYSVGRLRPHFLDVCRPNISALNCTSSISVTPIYIYVKDFNCSTTDDKRLLDSKLSFPSGHASFSCYTAVFIMLYLQWRMTWKRSKLLRPMFQAFLAYTAFYVCLSRITDFKHHYSDVLAGAVIGIFTASLVAIHVQVMFKVKNTHQESRKDVTIP